MARKKKTEKIKKQNQTLDLEEAPVEVEPKEVKTKGLCIVWILEFVIIFIDPEGPTETQWYSTEKNCSQVTGWPVWKAIYRVNMSEVVNCTQWFQRVNKTRPLRRKKRPHEICKNITDLEEGYRVELDVYLIYDIF